MRKLSLSKLLTLLVSSFTLIFVWSFQAYGGTNAGTATCAPQAAQIIDIDSCAVFGPAGDSDAFYQVAGITNYAYTGCGIGATLTAASSATKGSTHMIYITEVELTSVTDASGTTTDSLTHNIANNGASENNITSTTQVHSDMRLAQPTSFAPSNLCSAGKIASPDQRKTDFLSTYSGDTRNKASWTTDSADTLVTNQVTHLKCTISSNECTYADTAQGGTTGLGSTPASLMSSDNVYPASQLFWVTDDVILSSRFRGGAAAVITVTLASVYNATADHYLAASATTSLNNDNSVTNAGHF